MNKIRGHQLFPHTITTDNVESGFDGELIGLNAHSIQGKVPTTTITATNSTIPTSQAVKDFVIFKKERFISTEGQTEFVMTSYDPTKPIMVFLNGLYQEDEAE